MSMFEALRPLRGLAPWLNRGEEEELKAPVPPSPLEEIEMLVALAKAAGTIDRSSGTWNGVSRWAALQLIEIRARLETAPDGKSAELRARAAQLWALLTMDDRPETPQMIEDPGPDIP